MAPAGRAPRGHERGGLSLAPSWWSRCPARGYSKSSMSHSRARTAAMDSAGAIERR